MPSTYLTSDLPVGQELVRFLLDRIDEDEASLRKAARRLARSGLEQTAPSVERLRNDCVAKRQVIGAVQQLFAFRDLDSEAPVRAEGLRILYSMAVVYSDHRAFMSTWDRLAHTERPVVRLDQDPVRLDA